MPREFIEAKLMRLSSPEAMRLEADQDWSGLDRLFLEVFSESQSAEAKWALLTHERYEYPTLTLDAEFTPEFLEPLVQDLLAPGDDLAARLAILSALATLTIEGALSRPPSVTTAKVHTLATIDAAVGPLGGVLASGDAEAAAAAAMLLGRVPERVDAHVAALAELAIQSEPDSAAAALMALALGARHGGSALAGERVEALAPAHLESDSVILSVAASSALSLVAGEVPERARPALVRGMRSEVRTPASWGFLQPGLLQGDPLWGVVEETLAAVGASGLWLRALVDTMSAYALERVGLPAAFGRCQEIPAERLRLKFTGVSTGGVALGELTDFQRRVLVRMAHVEVGWHYRWPLGFHLHTEVSRFLAADGPAFRPLALRDITGVKRQWHAPLIWRRRVLGELVSEDEAARALAEGLPVKDLFGVIFSRMTRVTMRNLVMDDAAKQRDRQLVRALLDALATSGAAVQPAVLELARQAKVGGPWSRCLLAEALDHLHGPDGWPSLPTTESLRGEQRHFFGAAG